MGNHKAQLDWPDHAEATPHSPVQTRFPLSIPRDNAGVTIVAHVPSNRALILFRMRHPSLQNCSLRSKCLIPELFCWSNDMLSRENGRIEPFSDQSCQKDC